MSEWLSAADAGLALIKQVPSKRGSSPVKLAEYLSCGLPVVITDGIGDCSRVISDNRVGVVLERPDAAEDLENAAARLMTLLTEKDTIHERCKTTSMNEFDLHRVGSARYREIYERLLGK